MNTEVSVDLDRLVAVYIKIRDKKHEFMAAMTAQEEEFDLKLKAIELKLLEHCKETGVESVRTASGTFYRSVKMRYGTSDWESMGKFILENEAPELLEKRIHQGNMRQFLEDNPDKLPRGLNCDSEYTVTVRRKR